MLRFSYTLYTRALHIRPCLLVFRVFLQGVLEVVAERGLDAGYVELFAERSCDVEHDARETEAMPVLDLLRRGGLLAARAFADVTGQTAALLLDELVVTLLAHACLLAGEDVLRQGGQAVRLLALLAVVLFLALVWLSLTCLLLVAVEAEAATKFQGRLLLLTEAIVH